MTVKELRELLAKYPDDVPVWTYSVKGRRFEARPITGVFVMENESFGPTCMVEATK